MFFLSFKLYYNTLNATNICNPCYGKTIFCTMIADAKQELTLVKWLLEFLGIPRNLFLGIKV